MPGDDLEQLWADVQSGLARLVPENVYRIWLSHLRPTALDDSILYLEGPAQTVEWVRRRFGSTLSAAVRGVDPLLRRVELLAGTPGHDAAATATSARTATARPDSPGAGRRLNPASTFDEFVIAPNNRFAHAAALVVAELPANAYNPLFLHGPIGTGKTHLLQAVANYISTHDPQLRLRYTTAENFATEFRQALQTSGLSDFKRAHRSLDVLIIDDIGFFNNKKRSTEEFLFTVDELVGSGAQVVLSGDDPPCSMPFLGKRLQERLEGGLVVELEQPGPAARLAILRKRAPRLDDEPAQTEVLHYLAERVSGNIRTLEGALVRVHAYASLTQQPLTIELAEYVVNSLQADLPGIKAAGATRPSIDRIQSLISRELQLGPEDLTSPKRGRQVVYARQIAMYLCRELTPLSLPAISAQFGGRDHTTVLHAHRKITKSLLTDPEARELITRLTVDLTSGERTA
jgi:chromosomal replication initiator protein